MSGLSKADRVFAWLRNLQLLLPVLGDALRIAAGQQGFEHASVGKQGFDFVQLKFVSVELVEGGGDFQAELR